MGIRIFCDHCGNTVSGKPINKLGFGNHVQNEIDLLQHQQAYALSLKQQLYGGNPNQAATTTASPQKGLVIPYKTVELCDSCVPIWMDRVEKLCRQSDEG